jgi:anti-sigma regulatory factor (Ser/Thr protein kinase)
MDEQWTHEVIEEFDGVPESVRRARRVVTEAVADAGPAGDDAVLLLSELATNAVIHAGSPFRVVVRRRDDRLRVEVADRSRAAARRQRFSSTSGTGRGLALVDDLADRWGVEERDDGKSVWFELTVRPAGSEPGRQAARRSVDAEAAVEPDLDALLDELGGWDDDDRSDGVPTARAA